MSKESGGIGICGLLFLLFLTLKLLGVTAVAEWSWWWVTAPLWILTGPAISIVIGVLIGLAVVAGIAEMRTR